jgi:hypothetical protein
MQLQTESVGKSRQLVENPDYMRDLQASHLVEAQGAQRVPVLDRHVRRRGAQLFGDRAPHSTRSRGPRRRSSRHRRSLIAAISSPSPPSLKTLLSSVESSVFERKPVITSARCNEEGSMVGMLQILTYMLAFYLVVKGMEILQIALASNREKRDGIITIGVLMLIVCIVASGGFVMMQDQQATSVRRTTSAPSP